MEILFDSVKSPSPTDQRLQHTWSIDMYTGVAVLSDCVLMVAYLYAFYKAWTGTRYTFILVLLILLLLDSVGTIGAAFSAHAASVLISSTSSQE